MVILGMVYDCFTPIRSFQSEMETLAHHQDHPQIIPASQDIFYILDQDRIGKVTMREFFSACVNLHGKPRLADTAILRHLIQRTFVAWRKTAMALGALGEGSILACGEWE